MIPKIVHYIWFGGNSYSEKIQHCIDSWHKYLPDYEFMLWNEETFDVNSVRFLQKKRMKIKNGLLSLIM